jgi:hypothetical protein
MVKVRQILKEIKRTLYVVAGLFLISGGLSVSLTTGNVLAASINQRSVTLSTAVPSATASYTFGFVPGTAGAIQGLEFQACTLALGTCTAPSGLSFSSATGGTVSGWTNATNFAVDNTGANNCIAAANVLCAKRTQAASEAASGVHTVVFSNITNPSGTGGTCTSTNCTFFIRISTYNLTTYTTGSLVDAGTVAGSTTQTLTLNATIQEQLAFCIGATAVNDATTTPGTCASIAGTSVNLGVLSNSAVSVSPVTVANYNGNADNGVAELSTNASNGASISYSSIQQTGTLHQGALRVNGATCVAGTPVTDQCINSAGTTKTTLTAGTEMFGMAIAGVNCGNVSGAAYTCTFSSGAFNLNPTTNYNCNGIAKSSANTYPTTDLGEVSGTTTCSYAWDESGSSNTIASSTTIVGGEALILKFAATPNIVTPTGAYTAQASFIATPTF